MFTSSHTKALILVSTITAAVLAYTLLPSTIHLKAPTETFTVDNLIANTSIKDNGLTASTIVTNDGSKVLTSYAGSGCGSGSAIQTLSTNGGAACVAVGSGTVTTTGSANFLQVINSGTNLANWGGSGCGSGSALQALSGSGVPTCIATSSTSSSGLFNGTMTSIPTQSGLGFSNWNTTSGGSFSNIDQGILFNFPTGSTAAESAITAAAPATPYTVTATLTYGYSGGANSGNWGIGWAAGTSGTTGSTAAQWLIYCPLCSGGFQQRIFNATSATSVVSFVNQSAAYIRQTGAGIPWFLRLQDDGTTVTYSISFDGIAYTTVYSVAKASGFLGAGGYSRIGFMINDMSAGPSYVALLSWKITSP